MNNELTPTEILARQLIASTKSMGARSLAAGCLANETRRELIEMLSAA